MSVVTSVVILTGLTSSPTLDELNAAIDDDRICRGGFNDVTSGAGGTKYMQARVYAAAFNYLDWDAFVQAVWHLPWQEPSQLAVNFEEETGFTVYPLLAPPAGAKPKLKKWVPERIEL